MTDQSVTQLNYGIKRDLAVRLGVLGGSRHPQGRRR